MPRAAGTWITVYVNGVRSVRHVTWEQVGEAVVDLEWFRAADLVVALCQISWLPLRGASQ